MKFKEKDIEEALICLVNIQVEKGCQLQSASKNKNSEGWQFITDENLKKAQELAKNEFTYAFNEYNNWIFEDDYETTAEWELAINKFIQEVINEFDK